MTRTWGCIGLAGLIAVGLWGSVVLGFWKSDERKFAEATCLTAFDTQKCMKSHFPPGTNMSKLRKYLQGANFIYWANKNESDFQRLKFVSIRDNEKHNHRIAILVSVKNDIIIEISVIEGFSVEGWS